MACKPKSQLRMADGGELMRRFANRQPLRLADGGDIGMEQNRVPMSAQDQGAFAAMGGPQGVMPDAPTAAPAADPGRRERMLAAGQRTQTFMPTMGNIQTEPFDPHIRPLALRDGGTVPGKGTGDKIPALYEPGEFVVSNDMLDAAPHLREQLHDLRGNVLAAQGKTVAEADAQAVKGGALRAATGAEPPLLGLDPSVANRAAESAKQAAFEADTLAKAKLRAETMTQQARTMPPNGGPPNAPPGYRAGQKFTSGVKFAGKFAPAVGAAIEAGDVYDVAKAPGTTKIDVGTQAAEGVSKLAGAAVGGLAGAAAGGPFAPLTGLAGGIAGYYAPELATKALRWATGQDTASPIDRVRTQQTAQAALPTAAPAPVATQPAAPTVQPAPTLRGADGRQYLPEAVTDADRLQSDALVNKAFGRDTKRGGDFSMDAGINTLRGDPGAMKQANEAWAMRGAGIQASRDAKGGLVLSNSTAPEKMQYVGRNGAPTARYEDTEQYTNGQTQLATARASLRNPDGSTWSAKDNAIMAANLRDGVNPLRGTSVAAAQDAEAVPAIGEFGHNKAVAAKLARDQLKATLRGQDIELQSKQGTTAAAQRAQINDDRKYELDVARLGVETANKNRDDKRAADKAFDDRVVGMAGPEKAPAVLASINGWLARREAQLEAEIKANPKDPKNENRRGQINAIRDKGRGALDDAALRKLIVGFEGNIVADQGSGSNNPLNPWDGTSVNTNQPITSLTPDTSFTSRWLPGAGKYVTDNGQKILESDVKKNPNLRELIN